MTVKEIKAEITGTPFVFEKYKTFHPVSGSEYQRNNHNVLVYRKYRIHAQDTKKQYWVLKLRTGCRKMGNHIYTKYKNILIGCTLQQAIERAMEMAREEEYACKI